MELSIAAEFVKYAVDSGFLKIDTETGLVWRNPELPRLVRGGYPYYNHIDRKGYAHVAIFDPRSRIRRKIYVHQLVAYVKYGDPIFEPGKSIDHINCIKEDNRACNLELVTIADNTRKSNMRGWFPVLRGNEVIAYFRSKRDADEYSNRLKG